MRTNPSVNRITQDPRTPAPRSPGPAPISTTRVAGRQSLLNGRCSPKRAKEKLEHTFEQLSPLQKLVLARQLGYESFDSMIIASTVVVLSDGSAWWLTADRAGAWTAWNLCALEFPPGCQVNSR